MEYVMCAMVIFFTYIMYQVFFVGRKEKVAQHKIMKRIQGDVVSYVVMIDVRGDDFMWQPLETFDTLPEAKGFLERCQQAVKPVHYEDI